MRLRVAWLAVFAAILSPLPLLIGYWRSNPQQVTFPPLPSRDSRTGQTELMSAASAGNASAVSVLLQLNPDVSQMDLNQMNAMHYSIIGRHRRTLADRTDGDHETVFAMLISSDSVDCAAQCSVLYYAVQYRNIVITEQFLRKCPISNCTSTVDSDGNTPLHIAAWSKASGFAGLLQRLAKSPARHSTVNMLKAVYDIDVPASLNFTYQQLTAAISDKDVTLLLHYGAQLSLRDGVNNTAVHLLLRDGRGHMILRDHSHTVCPLLIAVNSFGQTPLHLAMASGHCAMLSAVNHCGCDIVSRSLQAVDNFDRTAYDVALLNRFSDCSQELQLYLTQCGATVAHKSDVLQRTPTIRNSTGSPFPTKGWSKSTHPRLTDVPFMNTCNMSVVDGPISAADFLQFYVSINRPVLIRRGAYDWVQQLHWADRTEFVTRFGKLRFQVGSIPYAAQYGEAQTSMTAAEFVQRHMNPRSAMEYPLYIFDGGQSAATLLRNVSLPELCLAFSPTPTLTQFMLGPEGSGAPPHFHGNAVNLLVFGSKLWTLQPPAEGAFFSSKPVRQWFRDSAGSVGRVFTCVQSAGDVLYVPRHWGHAVLNTMDSAAVAYEF
eukprot:TRINITY_DN15051_c0_g1_i1.p1 TRINITY_DN15051_c0_g1~~TRINITY_DN15051_c0_g1_i1.p1  ORF type:complete len:602 (+),score=92.85 TRINITY_DN15051_c0_g1_i1:3-1808(+)